MAARSGDPFAVQRLLGHADLKMATRYVQDVSKQTDEVVLNGFAVDYFGVTWF
jgi:integrase